MALWAEIASSVLLFFLVFGMSATVDIRQLRKQVSNKTALLIGISLQFIILPFLGFVVVNVLNMDAPMGITLLVITSSPGGSYSNWWCSIFNADLALSVTMTTVSTLLSIIMLPVNLVLYATTSFSDSVVKSLDWKALFMSLLIVIGGIFSGLICSATIKSLKFNILANKLGNIAGLLLVTFSIVVSSSGDNNGSELWNQPAFFYIGVAMPCLFGLLAATWMVSCFRLEKPERVAVAVECCYQNTGIATSVAAAVFEGDELAVAVGVPLFYGICEAVFLAIYCTVCWKMGWTKAPADENCCKVISESYEIKEMIEKEPESIEVVLSTVGESPTDLIFSSTQGGYQIDEVSLESLTSIDNIENGGINEFTIGDLEEEDQDETNTEIDSQKNTSSPVVGRRKRGQYKNIQTLSPTSSDSNGESDAPQGLHDTNPKSNPVKKALSKLRGVRSNGMYTKAVTEAEEDVITDITGAGRQID
mmetsp:Transcript_3016/g.4442  ORF Transcript_3016/g.4442 Transcript_3016/m.4442 type:complete len:476 (-) Transcript_3016:3272-4699(-)